MDEEYLQLSGIQHFAFCRRQWALIHIENQWVENGLTAEGRSQHTRVHDADKVDFRNGTVIIHDMRIHSRRLGFSGSCDAVELIPDPNGVTVFGRSGTWRVRPVEYKHGEQKDNDCDRLQVTAQAICLEEMLCCHIDEAAIFYLRTRRREKVTIDPQLRQQVDDMAKEMKAMYDRGHTPIVKPNRSCYQCSLKELCIPTILKRFGHGSVRSYMDKHMREEEANPCGNC